MRFQLLEADRQLLSWLYYALNRILSVQKYQIFFGFAPSRQLEILHSLLVNTTPYPEDTDQVTKEAFEDLLTIAIVGMAIDLKIPITVIETGPAT